MKKLIFLAFAFIVLFLCNNNKSFSQEIVLDTTGTTPPMIVEDTTKPTTITTPIDTGTTIRTIDTNKVKTKVLKFTFLEDDKNKTTWSHFRIDAKIEDDDRFGTIQSVLGVVPPMATPTIVVNMSDPNIQLIYLGDEGDPNATPFQISQLPDSLVNFLVMYSGINKTNLTKHAYNYGSVFLDAIKRVTIKDFLSPPKRELEIVNSVAYINQYLNFFGGDPLGLPIKRGFGFSIQLGTPYSGPLETDMIGGSFHMLGGSVGITTRIKEFILKRSLGATKEEKDSKFGNYNNIFTPKLGLMASYVVPFGNFLQIGYYSILDTGDYDPPIDIVNNDSTRGYKYMPNNVLVKGGYLNFEFRYPLRVFRSTRSKIYIAKYLGEFHAGFVGRELTLAGSIFDVRINATFGSTKRNTQILLEAYVSSIGEGFSLSSFAMGPSIRLTRTPDGSMGVVTVLLNARLKVGDFWDDRYK